MNKESKTGTPDYIKLLRDEDVFSSIIENLGSGIAIIDNKGRFVSYNKKFLNLFGLSEGSTIRNVNDQNWADWKVFNEDLEILHVDDHPVRKAAITGKIVKNQLVGVKLPSAGDIIWMMISAEPLFNEHGKIEKTICTYLDVTEHKLVNEALRKSEQRYRQLFNSMSEIFQVIELIHDETGKAVDYCFKDVNPAFENLAGRSKDQILNKRIKELFGSINPDWCRTFDEIYRTGNPIRFESWGDIFKKHYEIFAWKTAENNIAVILSDISERKVTEAALFENEKRLRELNNTKDKLYSIISHDLKTPFTSILGFSELLLKKLKKGDFEGIQEYARIIYDSSWNAMYLLSNLIEWSRIQTGRMGYNPSEFDIVKVINEVSDLLYASAMHKSISIFNNIPEQLNVFADRSMISTVLRNIISNSIKFTGTDGKIEISAAKRDNQIIIEVKDNGIGMSQDIISNIFNPEGGISTPGTMNETGTGLGMILCREFISLHKGDILVDSESGKGTRFVISMPDALQQEQVTDHGNL